MGEELIDKKEFKIGFVAGIIWTIIVQALFWICINRIIPLLISVK